jgi:hypothetical protein
VSAGELATYDIAKAALRRSGAPPLLPGEEHAARRRRAYTLRFALRGEGAAASTSSSPNH